MANRLTALARYPFWRRKKDAWPCTRVSLFLPDLSSISLMADGESRLCVCVCVCDGELLFLFTLNDTHSLYLAPTSAPSQRPLPWLQSSSPLL